MIENVSNELKKYFESKPVLSALLPVDMYLFFGCVILQFIMVFANLGGFISSLVYYLFFLSLLLCLANKNFFALMIGLGVKALTELIDFIKYLAKYEMFMWGYLFAILVYGFFAYMAFRKYSARSST